MAGRGHRSAPAGPGTCDGWRTRHAATATCPADRGNDSPAASGWGIVAFYCPCCRARQTVARDDTKNNIRPAAAAGRRNAPDCRAKDFRSGKDGRCAVPVPVSAWDDAVKEAGCRNHCNGRDPGNGIKGGGRTPAPAGGDEARPGTASAEENAGTDSCPPSTGAGDWGRKNALTSTADGQPGRGPTGANKSGRFAAGGPGGCRAGRPPLHRGAGKGKSRRNRRQPGESADRSRQNTAVAPRTGAARRRNHGAAPELSRTDALPGNGPPGETEARRKQTKTDGNGPAGGTGAVPPAPSAGGDDPPGNSNHRQGPSPCLLGTELSDAMDRENHRMRGTA